MPPPEDEGKLKLITPPYLLSTLSDFSVSRPFLIFLSLAAQCVYDSFQLHWEK